MSQESFLVKSGWGQRLEGDVLEATSSAKELCIPLDEALCQYLTKGSPAQQGDWMQMSLFHMQMNLLKRALVGS